MFNLVEKRTIFFLISAAILLPGIAVMIYSFATTGAPFRLGIDFVGGSIYELQFTEPGATETNIRAAFSNVGDDGVIIQQLGGDESLRWSVRGSFLTPEENTALESALEELAPLDRETYQTSQVSPTVGLEVTRAAFAAVLLASAVITGFIVFSFRQVPNAFRYGVCAIVAMLHDILVVMSAMSLLGLLLGWEVDALFLTAVLTVVGFSVQDSIVVFDRIRENIPRHLGEPYETIVNRSLWETMHRSLATQLNAFFIMIAILLFGGDTIKPFIFILFVGLLSGSYSSLFTAVPMLVAWEKGEIPFLKGSVEAYEEKEAALA